MFFSLFFRINMKLAQPQPQSQKQHVSDPTKNAIYVARWQAAAAAATQTCNTDM